jgi:replication factor C small subunit
LLNKDDVIQFLQNIADSERLKISELALETIYRLSEGDMRKAINILQMSSVAKNITEEVIYQITNKPEPREIRKMLKDAMAGKFKLAREQLLKLLYERGLSGEDLIKEMHSQIFMLDISDEKKLGMIEKLGEYEFRLTEGSNPQIQLEALIANLALIGKG